MPRMRLPGPLPPELKAVAFSAPPRKAKADHLRSALSSFFPTDPDFSTSYRKRDGDERGNLMHWSGNLLKDCSRSSTAALLRPRAFAAEATWMAQAKAVPRGFLLGVGPSVPEGHPALAATTPASPPGGGGGPRNHVKGCRCVS